MKKNRGQNNAPTGFKKNPFKKHKEEVELKKKKESEETAKVYADFLASFQDSGDEVEDTVKRPSFVSKAFVKGETIKPSTAFNNGPNQQFSNQVMNHNELYKPQLLPSLNTNFVKETKASVLTSTRAPAVSTSKDNNNGSKKVRAMDEFLQEIKKQHEAEQIIRSNLKYQNNANLKQFQTYANPLKKKSEIAQKVVENGDPTSTCLYLGNISSELNEEIICQNFGVFGAIASVKITVPRNLEEGSRVRPCAFVSFMDRESAVSAKNVMDGTVLLGQTLKIGWGKPIIIPEKPFYDVSDKSKVIKTGNPFNARTVASAEVPADFKAVQFLYGRVPQPSESQNKNVLRLEVQVRVPQDRAILKLIHQTIEYVLLYGYDFEGHLLQKEANNEKYQFLYDSECDEHIYYRWKLYSLLQGDLVDSWRTEPFRIFEDGPYFIPPPLSGSDNRTHTVNKVREVSLPYDSDDSDIINRKGRNVEKKENEVDEWVGFFKQLNELNLNRNRIGLAMVFALEHVSQSEKLVGMIRSALIKEGNELNKSLAILYLISDILYNLSPTVPQAWKLRACIEQHLEAFFKHVHSQYRGIVARLKAESFRRQFAVLLELWESSLILPTTFLSRLTNLLNHGQPELPQELINVVQHNPIYEDNLDTPEGIIEEKIEIVKPKAVKKSNKKRSRKITQVLEEDEDLDMFG